MYSSRAAVPRIEHVLADAVELLRGVELECHAPERELRGRPRRALDAPHGQFAQAQRVQRTLRTARVPYQSKRRACAAENSTQSS